VKGEGRRGQRVFELVRTASVESQVGGRSIVLAKPLKAEYSIAKN